MDKEFVTQIKTCKEYNKDKNVEWRARREFLIYTSLSSRFKVIVENGDNIGDSLSRHEEYARQGIYDADLDAEEFTEDFIEYFCNHLSLREVRELTDALIKYRDQEEKSRERAMTKNVDLHGKF